MFTFMVAKSNLSTIISLLFHHFFSPSKLRYNFTINDLKLSAFGAYMVKNIETNFHLRYSLLVRKWFSC